MPKLAILGGRKVRTKKFPAYKTIGKEEIKAVTSVLKRGILSKFLGAWNEDFYGGPQVRALEKEWAGYFGVKHAIAVNSATSGIFCAVGASGVGPGDEVIVSPYTMSASAVAPLIYNAIPVFADIEEDYFCLSLESIEKNITKRTKAMIVVDIFGQPYDAAKINSIAKKHNLLVIEDAAQAPGAIYHDRYAGTLGDIGIFSLNYHKHIHTGEGGIVVTNNSELAERVRLIRNHAEAVIESKGYDSLVNMLGFNYRMTEIEAAIARQQLKKLSRLIDSRIENVEYLTRGLLNIPCLEPAEVRKKNKHVFYAQPIKFNSKIVGVGRDKFIESVRAELAPTMLGEDEGVRISCGYVKPLYLQPLYQKRQAYGKAGCPFSCEKYSGRVSYKKGICPVAEKMHSDILIINELIYPGMLKKDLDDIIEAFSKVWENRGDLA